MLSILYVILCGIALPVGGVQMQYLWRNQLGDIYSLGLGSAACLGAATATMTGWCSLTMGAFICQAACAVIVSLVALRLDTSRLITFGILFGTFVGSIGTIVVTNAPTGDLLRQYYLWGAANFKLEGVTTADVMASLAMFSAGLAVALLCAKRLTMHYKGEIELSNASKAGLLFMTSVLVTSVVSICGTIGFVSLGIPNLARVIIRPGDIRKQYALSSAMGTALLLVTYIVVEKCNFGIYLPVSATMALIALPLMVVLFRKKSGQDF
ncbi:MAG: iron chelate uptake ABC transporter family permease subunit [Bacteroidales bacterium]|nr:iron chelate uptake ABC transporter family permease subunit [Candidatus Cryptobacteroides choladohippi]